MGEFLSEYLRTYGYWVLFAGTFLEGETILVLAGLLAFQGYLHLAGVIATSFVGSFCGDQLYFYVGRWEGRRLTALFSLVTHRFRKALRLIEKYGAPVAFFSRFTYGFRIILPITLGMTRFSPRRYLLLNAASALLWASVFSCAGFLFGKSASMVVQDVEKYEPYLLLAVLGLMGGAYLLHAVHHWSRGRKSRARLKRRQEYLRENGQGRK